MKYEDPKVFNLLDPAGREAAADHVTGQLELVDEEMAKVRRDNEMLAEVDEALTRIQELLAAMKQIAEKAATLPNANKQVLAEKFDDMKKEIDTIAAGACSRWSAAESATIRRMVAGLSSAEL